jgi:hypothetical protein
VDEAVKIALDELDLGGCQAIWVVHNDTENCHVHITANRIDPETHRAIQPAERWTHRAIQRAARKIEISQGWEIESNGTYIVTADGELARKKAMSQPDSRNPKLSKTALDIEAHTAAKSAERIAQDTAAPIIRNAQSWPELHQRLASHGIAFERKGSGAVLFIGNTAVKASRAGRDLSMSKLESRLGEYRQRSCEVHVADLPPPEPVNRVNERNVKNEWNRYTEARERYYREKYSSLAALSSRQKNERSELKKKHRSEREMIFSCSWRGRGAALNRTRSITAASQQVEKLNLRDRHEREREEARKLFPARFPNFKRWLESEETASEETAEAAISFRYSGNGSLHGAGIIPTQARPEIPDIRAFTQISWNRRSVAYRIPGENNAEFIDYGKKIVLSERCSESAILAALQLANHKWGGAVINGTEEYKRACVALAIRHHLKIFNMEIAAGAETGRKNFEHGRREREVANIHNILPLSDKRALFNRYADATAADRFRIVVTEFKDSGTQAFLFDKKNGGYDGKTREEILEAIPKFSAYAHYNKNIIVTPISPDKHHILIDDLSSERLRQLVDDGYSPACVIESSPRNFQAVLTVPSVEGDAEKDRMAANKITRELNRKYGDPHLSGSVHGHRLPPFPNCKPKHRREDGTYPETSLIESNGGICEKTRQELESAHEEIKQAEARAKRDRERYGQAQNSCAAGTNDPNAAYWAHYRDITSKLNELTGARELPGSPQKPDCSRLDGMIGIRMRVTGYSQEQIRIAIEANAPIMRREVVGEAEADAKYKNKDWRRYATETADNFVFGLRGLSQYESARRYRPRLMKVEGRSAFDEDKRAREMNSEQERER